MTGYQRLDYHPSWRQHWVWKLFYFTIIFHACILLLAKWKCYTCYLKAENFAHQVANEDDESSIFARCHCSFFFTKTYFSWEFCRCLWVKESQHIKQCFAGFCEPRKPNNHFPGHQDFLQPLLNNKPQFISHSVTPYSRLENKTLWIKFLQPNLKQSEHFTFITQKKKKFSGSGSKCGVMLDYVEFPQDVLFAAIFRQQNCIFIKLLGISFLLSYPEEKMEWYCRAVFRKRRWHLDFLQPLLKR